MRVVAWASLAASLLMASLAMAACGGSTDGTGSGGSAGTGGVGGGGGVSCGACPLPLVGEGDACTSEGECCSYGGACPLIFACSAGAWTQQPSSNCGYAVPCGDQGLGCPSWQQCIAEPTAGGTSYSCGVSDGGAGDAAILPTCGCSQIPPTIGDACLCKGSCTHLICPAGEMQTIECVEGSWQVTMTAWDYYCGDGG